MRLPGRKQNVELVANRKQQHHRLSSNIAYKSAISVMVIVLSLGLFGILVVVACWFARDATLEGIAAASVAGQASARPDSEKSQSPKQT
jgi:hypothetical protein